MYEHRSVRPLPRPKFVRRVATHFVAAAGVVAFSLLVGTWGYMYFEALPWRDAFENAAMLLGGEGPVNIPHTDGGKVFAACYALYSGLVFLVVAGLLLAPIAHRLLHLLHWEPAEPAGGD
jgi:hypothetical protein